MAGDIVTTQTASVVAAEPTGRDVIRTGELTKVYRAKQGPGTITAVDGLDLSVRAGEIFGLLGPNGAGKTTTVGMLTTRIVPTSGWAKVGGVDVAADPAGVKRLIGVVPQGNTLDHSLTVWQNVYFHGRYFGMSTKAARAGADEMLERFRLTGRAHSKVHTLSGGMVRRLMVARACLHRPPVLFLDEPTAGLDLQSCMVLWDMVRELNGEGHTVLLTTHRMEEADQLCQRVAIMDHGGILGLDTPAALKRAHGSGATVTVTVRGDGDLAGLAERLRTVSGAREAGVAGQAVRLHVDEPEAALPAVVALVNEAGFTLSDLSVDEASLATVFINLTGRDLRE